MDQLPLLGKRELICLLLFICNYVVSVWRGFLFLWVLVMDYVILLWHSLSLPYNNFEVWLLKQQHLQNAVFPQYGFSAKTDTSYLNILKQNFFNKRRYV